MGNEVATSQIALPKAACDDNVFSDGSALELATMTGSVSGGLTAALSVAV